MTAVLIAIHLILALAMIGIILLQQSEGGMGGLGGGGSGGMGGFMTGRATANLLTRITATLAGLFFVTSMVLGILADQNRRPTSILDFPGAPANQSPAPAQPALPTVPTPPTK
jgi:preprotein translocase subunit SecG